MRFHYILNPSRTSIACHSHISVLLYRHVIYCSHNCYGMLKRKYQTRTLFFLVLKGSALFSVFGSFSKMLSKTGG